MSLPPFVDALKQFKWRAVYGNARGDRAVGFHNSCLCLPSRSPSDSYGEFSSPPPSSRSSTPSAPSAPSALHFDDSREQKNKSSSVLHPLLPAAAHGKSAAKPADHPSSNRSHTFAAAVAVVNLSASASGVLNKQSGRGKGLVEGHSKHDRTDSRNKATNSRNNKKKTSDTLSNGGAVAEEEEGEDQDNDEGEDENELGLELVSPEQLQVAVASAEKMPLLNKLCVAPVVLLFLPIALCVFLPVVAISGLVARYRKLQEHNKKQQSTHTNKLNSSSASSSKIELEAAEFYLKTLEKSSSSSGKQNKQNKQALTEQIIRNLAPVFHRSTHVLLPGVNTHGQIVARNYGKSWAKTKLAQALLPAPATTHLGVPVVNFAAGSMLLE
mmetsp:Transcript_2274/g.4197  ORF Transcript_2274/g.4197 Transcript_2274/m.4197 type:complete len:383 (-) Transcript_2274:115-1263(-)